jgi:hypothetical protein
VKLIWATRGRTWGFRFLARGGFVDPLPEYDAAFAGLDGQSEVCTRVGDRVVLRFPDPLGRKDAAGRVIPQEFIVFPPLSESIHTIEDGLELVWERPQVAAEYARVWSLPKPPKGS